MQALVSQAYGQVQKRTASPRDIEYSLFEQITSAMEFVSGQDAPTPTEYVDAISRNLDFWSRLTSDLASENNQLPLETRQLLLGIAEFVRKTSMQRLSDRGDLNDMIEINRNVMQGLRPRH